MYIFFIYLGIGMVIFKLSVNVFLCTKHIKKKQLFIRFKQKINSGMSRNKNYQNFLFGRRDTLHFFELMHASFL